jgi:tryptophan synthase beta chain
MTNQTDFSAFPDENGHFGIFGGRFVSETLISPWMS